MGFQFINVKECGPVSERVKLAGVRHRGAKWAYQRAAVVDEGSGDGVLEEARGTHEVTCLTCGSIDTGVQRRVGVLRHVTHIKAGPGIGASAVPFCWKNGEVIVRSEPTFAS